MSISAGIKVQLIQRKNGSEIFTIEVIKSLIAAGWALFRSGKASYLPLGDTEFLNYRYGEAIEYEQLVSIIEKKEQLGELVAVDLFWNDTLIGDTVMFLPAKNYCEILIGVSSDRQTVQLNENYSITNFQWYLERLLPPLNAAFGVESFSCQERK